MAKALRLHVAALRALAVAVPVLTAVLLPQGAAAADTPWGSSGASYRSGIVCALPDGRRVALASWAVDGATAFATADVVARGTTYGPAPSSGRVTDLAPGTRGLDAAQLAALSYLIGHYGSGTATPTQVAETSALVAQAFGGGAAQQACLGRQGTSSAAAATLAVAARRYAGPYTVQVPAVQAKPGSSAPVSATVLSASGVPTPGIAVTFSAGGVSATGTTGNDGRATARVTAPTSVAVLTATAAEPTGLRLIASRPASVGVRAATPATGRATVVPVLHPTPRLTLGGGTALVLAGGSLSPAATLTGTYGYSGTGTVSVVGPVTAPTGGSCSAASFSAAPSVWNGTFAFAGDGPRVVGTTGGLRPGCYAFAGTLTTTDASPAVTATALADPASAVGVSAVRLSQDTGSGLARTGPLTATVTATAAAGATVHSTVTTYGPLPAGAGGRCDTGRTWTGARVLARSAAETLAPQSGGRSTVTVRTPPVTGTGCYALVARSTVTQDGRSAVVSAAPGAAGTTVLVIAPSVGVTNSSYDGRQGVPMTGTVHVTGTDGLAGQVEVGLVSAPASATGCHDVTFPAATTASATGAAGSTTVSTDGDGDYPFRSPVPSGNRCYGVVATLAMAADPAVRVAAPAPGDAASFLAGAVVTAPADIEIRTRAAAPATRELAVLGVAGAVMLVVALLLMLAAAVAGEHKPDPRAGELLVEITESPRETVGV